MRAPLTLRPSTLLLLPAAALLALTARSHAAPDMKAGLPAGWGWKKTVLDTRFRSEGAFVVDLNKDGRSDILCGTLWYENPGKQGGSWKLHEIRPAETFNGATGYSNSFLTFAADLDRDGWMDPIVIGFPGAKAVWFRNPGKAGGEWTEHLATESACNESPIWADLDGDKQPELVTPFKESQMAFYKPGATPTQGLEQHLIGAPDQPGVKRFSHGLGVGDVNGDKRPDILCTEGYYEQPAEKGQRPWKFVPAKLGPAAAQMHTYDFDGDGDMDVISSSAHQIGVWWYEQKPGAPNSAGPEFVQHTLDNTVSQTHCLIMADLNGDKQPDFITGKRWWAHGPNGDVNPGDPAMLLWYEFRREGGTVKWIRHEIDNDSGVGTQSTVADVNGDRRPDIAISNKKGVFLFEQVRTKQ